MERETARHNIARADRYVGRQVTLDGHPAKICGRMNRFATVGTLNGPLYAVEFSWEAVEHVMQTGGKFSS